MFTGILGVFLVGYQSDLSLRQQEEMAETGTNQEAEVVEAAAAPTNVPAAIFVPSHPSPPTNRIALDVVPEVAPIVTNVLKPPSTPKEWKDLASKGDIKAQVELGKLLLSKHDYNSAYTWFEKAALQGDAVAQRNMGEMFLFGHGTEPDFGKAVVWFSQAAEQGDNPAQYSLGMRYHFGQGVARDDTEAVWWWALAAEQGNNDAQASLARRYEAGEGVLADPVEAYKWFDVADKAGHLNAGDARDELAKTMSASEIARAKAKSDAFVPTELKMK